jgi:hypothetical protein
LLTESAVCSASDRGSGSLNRLRRRGREKG